MSGLPLSRAEIDDRIRQVPLWYHRIEVAPGVFTPGSNDSARSLERLKLPEDCRGLRALDLGTRDGFFAFELERRGADVLAIDNAAADQTGFPVAAGLLGSRVPFRQMNVFDLRPENVGTFDVVLFLGLLYHLPDPMRALRIVRSLCRKSLYLESHVIDEGVSMPDGSLAPLARVAPALAGVPIAQFYPRATLAGDPYNFWGPNMACLRAMLEESEFRVVDSALAGSRGIFRCEVAVDPSLRAATDWAYGGSGPR